MKIQLVDFKEPNIFLVYMTKIVYCFLILPLVVPFFYIPLVYIEKVSLKYYFFDLYYPHILKEYEQNKKFKKNIRILIKTFYKYANKEIPKTIKIFSYVQQDKDPEKDVIFLYRQNVHDINTYGHTHKSRLVFDIRYKNHSKSIHCSRTNYKIDSRGYIQFYDTYRIKIYEINKHRYVHTWDTKNINHHKICNNSLKIKYEWQTGSKNFIYFKGEQSRYVIPYELDYEYNPMNNTIRRTYFILIVGEN